VTLSSFLIGSVNFHTAALRSSASYEELAVPKTEQEKLFSSGHQKFLLSFSLCCIVSEHLPYDAPSAYRVFCVCVLAVPRAPRG
jgi:hypothetical protein